MEPKTFKSLWPIRPTSDRITIGARSSGATKFPMTKVMPTEVRSDFYPRATHEEQTADSADSSSSEVVKMLKRERRPDFRTIDRRAIRILPEAGAIHKCDQHGWAKERADPHA